MRSSPGISIAYTGQFEYLERATERLKLVVPATLLIIFVLLYLTFGSFAEAALVMATLPFALTGGVWLLYLLGYNQSVATGVGLIALAGVSAEFGVVMLIYLKSAMIGRDDTDAANATHRPREAPRLESVEYLGLRIQRHGTRRRRYRRDGGQFTGPIR